MAPTVVIDDALTIPVCDGLAGFRDWTRSPGFSRTGRIDWVAGSIEVDMSPGNLFIHGTLKTEIAATINGAVRAADLGDVFTERRRLVCPAADLVVEIVSDSSLGRDTRRLPEAYAKAVVGEPWLIDARHCGTGDVQPEFRLLTWHEGHFAEAPELAGEPVSPSLGKAVRPTKAHQAGAAAV